MKKSTVTINQEKKSIKNKSVLQEKLVASELRYRRMFETTKDGMLILDAESGKIVDVNPFLIELLGYTKKEFIEKSIWDIGTFQNIFENQEKFLELKQREYLRYEDLPLETSDGKKIYVEFVSNVYFVENQKVIQCQIRDITTRKETEAALEKTRKELAEIKKTADELNKFTENVIDTIREPLLAIDKDLRVIKASRSFYQFFKVTADETIGKLIYELGNHQWDIPKLKELLEEIIPEQNSFDNFEVEHHFSSIGKRVMLLNARQVKRVFGKEKIILLAIEDITERKGKEVFLKEKHRATSNSLNVLLNHMHAPIIIWDTSMIIKRFNHKFELLSGYDSTEVIDKKIDFLFPKEKIATTLELLKKNLDDEQEVIEIDILTKGNRIKTVLWTSSSIMDEEGNNIVATISQDITSRKHTEDALNFSETRYRRLFESAKDGILILDAGTGKIADVNPFLIDLLGYSKEEFIEKSVWEIGAFKDIYDNKEKFFELQKEKYVRYDDLPLVTSDGQEIHVEFVSNVYLANNIKVIQCNIRDITERTNTQKELKFQAELINNVGQSVIATDLLGKVIYWNHAAEKIYGWSASEAIGENIMNLTPAVQSNEQAVEIMNKLSAGKTWAGEFQVKRKDGSSFPAFVTDTPMLDADGNLIGIIGISSDITESKQVQQKIKESEDKFRTITENSADPIFITDKNGKYIYVNKQAVDLLGYSKKELLTFTLADISPKNRIDEYFQIFQQLFTTGSSYSEIELVKKDGSYAETDLNAVLLPNGWIYGSCRDISERKQLENELIHAKEKAEESDRLKTSFLHNVSHEIRTPMNAIVGFSRFINNPDLMPEKRKHYTEIIVESSNQLLAIIDDIISIASIEAGQEKIQENEININSTGKLIHEQFFQKANEKNITLSLKTSLADDEATIITDATKLTQVISNLLGNALKFTEQGSVNFGYYVKDQQLEFYIEDSGMGIPLDMQEIIFNRFRQIETTDKRLFGGSGLGLSISKAYVELLGGKMWLTSELGKGSVFYFTIPYKNTNTKKLPEIPSVKESGFEFITNKTVLIAEDEISNFILLDEMFLDSGITIIRAANGIEAVNLCKSHKNIDLVLMDLKMPEMDGYEATRRIKEFRPELPIIAQTAYSTADDINKALECGCSDFISKPLSQELLLSKMNEQLHKIT